MQPMEQVKEHDTREVSLLDKIAENQAQVAARYQPVLTVKQFTAREQLLRELKDILVEDIDYGVIPGTNDKPVLLLPGAQKLCTFFGYVPHYVEQSIEEWTTERFGEPLFYYKYTCTLLKDGKVVGEGIGSCNSWEAKYRWRIGKRACPSCGNASLIEGKQWKAGDPKEWICFMKKGGCGAKFAIDDQRITGQQVGRVANPDVADSVNTCQKIGQKRSYIASTLSATGASQYFTQDLEDLDVIDTGGHPKGTQEAADHVAQRKIAEAKSSVPQAQAGPSDPVPVTEGRGGTATAAPLSELEAYLKRCTNVRTAGEVFAELCALIEPVVGAEGTDKIWGDAIKQFGDPAIKFAATKDVLAFLYQQAQTAKEVAA